MAHLLDDDGRRLVPHWKHFFKYQGLGNDFVLLDRREDERSISPQLARALCDRTVGVGADGVLSIMSPAAGEAHLRVEIHNADGSIAKMCGNGLRCCALHAISTLSIGDGRSPVVLETAVGNREAKLVSMNGCVPRIRVEMGRPLLEASDVPVRHPLPEEGRVIEAPIEIGGRAVFLTAVSMGNPHAVIFDPEGSDTALAEIGAALDGNPAFPNGVNTGLARLTSKTAMELAVWERGVGATRACGSGACAAVVAAALTGRVEAGASVEVRLPGGNLSIELEKDLSKVALTGPAQQVYTGTLADGWSASYGEGFPYDEEAPPAEAGGRG